MTTRPLKRLFAPMSLTTFFKSSWQRQPVVVPRRAPRWLSSWPGLEHLQELLARTPSTARLVRSERHGQRETEHRDEPPALSARAAALAWEQGWTVNVNGVHRVWSQVTEVAAALARRTQCRVGANVYATPPKGKGFAPHADGHDVLVLQLSGRKHWSVYEPVERLPLPFQGPADAQPKEVQVDRSELKGKRFDCTLREGHLLYLPRGFVHEAQTSEHPSVHITFNLQPPVWLDLLREVLTLVAEEHLPLDDTFSFEGPARPDPALLRERLRAVLEVSAKGAVLDRVLERVHARHLSEVFASTEGRLQAVVRAGGLKPSSVLVRCEGQRALVIADRRGARFQFEGGVVPGPASLEPALRHLALHRRFTLRSLYRFAEPAAALHLVQLLVREGFLTVARQGSVRA